ncbi:MAG: class I SAM-dependent methyltransferase [Proteobacteria bacterium]|nr:class I SAM-dependent methyltransferase [Pseudomonadota bacterium]
MANASSFDARAATWDEDPGKRRRAAAVADAIRRQVKLSADMSAMEYGAGTGLLSFELADELGSILLTDSSIGMLDVARSKVAASGASRMAVRALDLTQDPLPMERFDIIYSMMTLHHVPDTGDLLRKLYTLLRPGGHLCVADLDAEVLFTAPSSTYIMAAIGTRWALRLALRGLMTSVSTRVCRSRRARAVTGSSWRLPHDPAKSRALPRAADAPRCAKAND